MFTGQGKQHWQQGVLMVICLYMIFSQGQADQQDKLDAQSQMATCPYPFIFCRLCLFSVVFAFVRMPQLIPQ